MAKRLKMLFHHPYQSGTRHRRKSYMINHIDKLHDETQSALSISHNREIHLLKQVLDKMDDLSIYHPYTITVKNAAINKSWEQYYAEYRMLINASEVFFKTMMKILKRNPWFRPCGENQTKYVLDIADARLYILSAPLPSELTTDFIDDSMRRIYRAAYQFKEQWISELQQANVPEEIQSQVIRQIESAFLKLLDSL